MYVCEDHQFVYFGNPKAASTKIISLLRNHFSIQGVANEASDYYPNTPHHSMVLPSKYASYFKFTSVRNPYSRELSKYNFRPKLKRNKITYEFLQELSIEEYLDWICKRDIVGDWVYDYWKLSQRQMIFSHDVPKNCVPVEIDAYVRTEHLAEDLGRLDFLKSIPKIEYLSQLNANVQYRETVFPASRITKFVDAFQEDFDLFGYSYRLPSHLAGVKHL